jgi:hypothetical protein
MRPVRLTRAEQQALTRERLLAAAERVLAGHGYGGASIDLITAERDMAELGRIVSLPPQQLSAALSAWLETMHCDSDCPLLVTELQLHARRNPVFAKRYYALQDQQTRALARILERFFEAQSVPLPMDPRDLAGCMTALAHGLSLQHPQPKPGARSTAGRVIGALLKLLTQR